MKRIQYLAVLLSLLVLLSACGGKNNGNTEPATADLPDVVSEEPESVTAPVQTEPETEAPVTEPEPVVPETDPISEPDRPELSFAPIPEPAAAGDYAQIRSALLAQDYDSRYAFYTKSRPEEEGDEPVYAAELEDTSAVLPIPGVEKGSRAVADGGRIYLIDSYGLIIQTADGAASEQLSYTEVKMGQDNSFGHLIDLYALEDRVAVVYEVSAFGTDENGDWFDRSETHAAIFDVTDPTRPELVRDVGVDGRYLTSRLADGTLYLVANHYLVNLEADMELETLVPNIRTEDGGTPMEAERIWLCANPGRAGFTALLGLRLTDGAPVDALAFTDTTDWFAMDSEGMYLARDVWSWTASEPYADGVYTVVDYADRCQTEIKRLIRTEDGILEPEASCLVEGSTACMYGLSPWDGMLRLVTREDRGSYSSYTDAAQGWSIDRAGTAVTGNRLTVLDRDLQEIGTLTDFAENDRIYLCGYAGLKGWLMTYSKPECFYPLDLTDPENPTVGAPVTLMPEGWLLRPYTETRVLCLTETKDGVSVSVYDADGEGFDQPAAAGTVPSVYTDAISFPGSVWQDPDTGRVGFPLRIETEYGYVLCEFTADGLRTIAVTELDYLPSDAVTLFSDGLLYVCSAGATYVIDPANGELLTTISNAVG
ncbi:MAG: beta-propeller domain-containing protein [Oscillospiraceae bacterium]|nr:beta-propeller domain-containing protein [Oscillospiraceae bacterium]